MVTIKVIAVSRKQLSVSLKRLLSFASSNYMMCIAGETADYVGAVAALFYLL